MKSFATLIVVAVLLTGCTSKSDSKSGSDADKKSGSKTTPKTKSGSKLESKTGGGKPEVPVASHSADEKAVIATIENLGGSVTIKESDLSRPVTRVSLFESKISNAELEQLAKLTKLQVLSLAGTPVGDSGLAHLKNLTSLLSLNLNNTQVTGAGLAHLAGLTNLQTLSLSQTQITDAA